MPEQGNAPRSGLRRRGSPRRWGYRRPNSAAAQLLIDAALDVLGAICLLALARGLCGLAVEAAWMGCLGVAGVDLILRTTVRALLARAAGFLLGLAGRLRRRRLPASALAPPAQGFAAAPPTLPTEARPAEAT